jgi:acyl-CoA thioesterase YciA
MLREDDPAKPASASRMSLAIITEPGQANPYGTLHGGVLLRLADECGAICALRHAGRGQITTAAIDSMTFLGPVYVGERVEFLAEVTYVGRTSMETRIEVYAEPFDRPERRRVAVGYALYVALDESGRRPQPVPPLLIETDAHRRQLEAARARQDVRLARRADAQAGEGEDPQVPSGSTP